ncbi:hypothetical protein FPV67DRAFT_1115472 [Lyophyllum atratum]|nr:hypothetical protein FPV67DRAFT_1115472 [Lyophyllum atratum]
MVAYLKPSRVNMPEDLASPTIPFHAVPATVTQLRYVDIFRAANMYRISFARDPMFRYIRNDREQTRAQKIMERLLVSISLIISIRTGVTLTVDAGIATVKAVPPKYGSDKPERDPVVKLAHWLTKNLVQKRDRMVRDPEAKKRQQELRDKTREAVRQAIGDRIDRMWLLDGIWIDPASQGQGYGGALVGAVTMLADRTGHTTWLKSSNLENTAFYNKHGFETIHTMLLGDDNPTWQKKPIPISIMTRAPRWPPSVDLPSS